MEGRLPRTWPMHVTLGEEGSWVWVSMVVVFFFLTNIGLDLDFLLLLLASLLLRNLMSGGGNLSVRPGLEMGLADSFMVCGEERNLSAATTHLLSNANQIMGCVWGSFAFCKMLFPFLFFCCGLFKLYCIFARMAESALLSRSFFIYYYYFQVLSFSFSFLSYT